MITQTKHRGTGNAGKTIADDASCELYRAVGDVMLAQQIALETNELDVLSTANR